MKAHNDVVAKIRDDTFANKSKEVEALHDRIISKQENAAVKREENQLTWVQKLATSTKDKLGRGKKVLEEEASAKQELESKIEIKDVSANLRRDELIQKKVEELTVINDSKLRRGRLSLELKAVEAQQLENKSEQKLVAATHRREMKHILNSIKLGDEFAEKKDRAAEVFKREEEAASRTALKLKEKLKLAEERKEKRLSESSEQLAVKVNDKRLRGAAVLNGELQRAKETQGESLKRVEEANRRRDLQLREQQEKLLKSATKKETAAKLALGNHTAVVKAAQKTAQSKVIAANLRREDILSSKVLKAAEDDRRKKEQAVSAAYAELEEAADRGKVIEKKMKVVSARKDTLLRAKVQEMAEANQSKIARVDHMISKQEYKELQQSIELENKIAVANDKRDEKLASIVSKSTKKRMVSPRSPSTNTQEIEARINAAASRREMFLLSRSEKANANKSLSPRSDLFANVTPRSNEEGGVCGRSPRIKAARLEEFHRLVNEEENEFSNFNQSLSGISLPLAVIGGLALAFIGIISFCSAKH